MGNNWETKGAENSAPVPCKHRNIRNSRNGEETWTAGRTSGLNDPRHAPLLGAEHDTARPISPYPDSNAPGGNANGPAVLALWLAGEAWIAPGH